MANLNPKEAAKILEDARKAQQFTLGETGKNKPKPKIVPFVVAVIIGYLIATYFNII